MNSVDLPVDLQGRAFDEFGETPEIREKAISDLRTQIMLLPEEDQISNKDDHILVRYLRCRKYDIGKALQQTINVAKFRRTNPSWVNGQIEEFKLFSKFFQVLKNRDSDGRVIVVLRPVYAIRILTQSDAVLSPDTIIRCNICLLETLSRNPYAQVCGVIIINSFHGLTLWDNMSFTRVVKIEYPVNTLRYIQSCAGFRVKAVFICDQPVFVSWIWSIASLFLTEKLKSRFHFCGSNYSIIREFIPDTSILPQCVGGQVEDGAYDWIQEQIELQYEDSK